MTTTRTSPSDLVSRRSPKPIAGDPAEKSLAPIEKPRRRRQPSSSGAKAKSEVSPKLPAPSPLEPASESIPAQEGLSPVSPVPAASEPSSRDADSQCCVATHRSGVSAPREPNVHGGEANEALSSIRSAPRTSVDTLNAIRETHRQRNDFIKAEGNLQRQVKAICRRAVNFSTFDPAPERAVKMKAAAVLFAAVEKGGEDGGAWVAFASTVRLRKLRDDAGECRKDMEKHLVKLAKTTHIAEFVEQTPGFGYIGLGQIIGEAGDLGTYANPAKLWKRMGLGLISNGQRQQKFTDKNKALEAGYSPRRRSTMFVIGDSMIKAKGPYRDLYLARKAFEVQKAETAGKRVLPAAKIKKTEAAACMSDGHVHIRAQRYMEKRLLRSLWRAWRGQIGEGSAYQPGAPNGAH